MKSETSTWQSRVEMLLLGATVVLSSLVSILDFFGVLDGIPWLGERIPTLTLLAVGLIASYIILERRTKLESIHADLLDSVQKIMNADAESARLVIQSLQGVELREFDDVHALLKYANQRLEQASVQVDDLSWHATISRDDRFKQTRAESVRHWRLTGQATQRIPYREVFIFNRRGRVEKLKLRIRENAPGYRCAYYREVDVPVLQFMIIDKEEVIVLSGDYPYLSIRHPRIAALFFEYYEDIWERAEKLKDVQGVYWDRVKEVLLEHDSEAHLAER